MAQVLCTALLVAWFAFLISAQQVQEGSQCDVGDHENNNGSYRAHPTDCSQYLQCQANATYGARQCSPGLHWNEEEEACDWPQKANCESFAFEQENVVGGQCDAGDHADNIGLYVAHPSECARFLQCLNGIFEERPCPPGLHWNAERGACDWPQNANCVAGVNMQPNYPRPLVQQH